MKRTKQVFITIVVLVALSLYVIAPETITLPKQIPSAVPHTITIPKTIPLGITDLHLPKNMRLGLDLIGGTHLVLEADMANIAQKDRNDALESVRSVIDRRINYYGVGESVIQTAKVGSSYRVLVELPGVKDTQEAINLIGQTAQLSFKEIESASSSATPGSDLAANASGSAQASPSGQIITFSKDVKLTGKNLKRSQVVFEPNSGKPIVELSFNNEGAKIFEDITRRNIGKPVAIFLDEQLISAPQVQDVITGGNAVISGKFTLEEAKNLSIALNAGALPTSVKIIEQRTVGATLGDKAIRDSIYAGILGLVVVGFFMIGNYGKRGIIADVALIIYALIVLALFKTIPVTLTLAGIAGFILSIGMAVDANILIFERMKEELHAGKSLPMAIEMGFSRAFPSIRDSNISSLMTAGILYWFGTGSVRGFALTLALGIIVSLFSSITVTRTLLRLFIVSPAGKKKQE